MSKAKPVDVEAISENLYRVTRKMSGLAWLIECHGYFDQTPEIPEETMLRIRNPLTVLYSILRSYFYQDSIRLLGMYLYKLLPGKIGFKAH